MIKKILYILCMGIAINSHAASINSFTITQATLSAALKLNGSCLNYQPPIRACIWFSPIAGKNVTPFLDHYLPDFVVVVYRNAGDDPWQEMRTLLDSPSASVQSSVIKNVGSGDHSFLNETEQQVIFKEADVIGNPALLFLHEHIGVMLLESTAKPMKPYYQSMLDSALWRGFMPQSLPEETSALALDVTHHIGTGINDWGGLYPHEGTVQGNNDLKASMVIAQRAADLLTNSQVFGHLHQSPSTSCGKHCKSFPISENSHETLFQMIYPITQSECAPLGSDSSYSDSMLDEKGAYVWIVWRHYQGCPDGDGEFVGVI
jgi:integrating conjugative element protein (TIGR03756 family)